MKIELLELTLTNFRGQRSLTIPFSGKQTTIYGDNRTGKTTVFNAFLWLLFGKDNLDRKDHQIKTLGPDNEPFHRLDHEVIAKIRINGEAITIKRLYKEKWQKKTGKTEPEFTGHETQCFWDEVPYKLGDFEAKVNSILKENVFKMITSTGYFNAMPWQDRRAILEELAGNIKDYELLLVLNEKQPGTYDELITALSGSKTLEQYKKELGSKKQKIKDELVTLPTRINEASRSLPEEEDYELLEKEAAQITGKIEAIDLQLQDKTKAQKAKLDADTAKIKKIGDLRVALSGIEFHIKNVVRDARQTRESAILDVKRELQQLNDQRTRTEADKFSEVSRKNKLDNEKAQLTAKWHQVSKEELVFDEANFACPTCKRAYEASGIEEKKAELLKNFNQNKSERLAEISSKGKTLAGEIVALVTKIGNYEAELTNLQKQITDKQSAISELTTEHQRLTAEEEQTTASDIAGNKEHQKTSAEIQALQDEINAPQEADENKEALLQEKRQLAATLAGYNTRLSTKDAREKTLARIEELTSSESEMANQLASYERIEHLIYQFTRAKMDEMEARINDRFKLVKFKMFRQLVGGGEEPCCETLIDGVPFGVANTASQINVGLDIINVLSDHFDIHAPVFVDNRESVVNLIPSGSQIINLVVVPGAMLSVNKIRYRKDYKPELQPAEA